MPRFVVYSSWFAKKSKVRGFKHVVLLLFTLFSSLFYVLPVYAAGISRGDCFNDDIAKLGCLPFYLGNIINGLFALSGIAAIILIIVSGIRLLLSGGNPEKVAKARSSLFYSIMGFLIVLFSFMILRVISFITGAECINALGINTCS